MFVKTNHLSKSYCESCSLIHLENKLREKTHKQKRPTNKKTLHKVWLFD